MRGKNRNSVSNNKKECDSCNVYSFASLICAGFLLINEVII